MSRRRKSLGALDQSLIDFRAFDAVSIEDDTQLKKRLDQVFDKIRNLERRLSVALNTQEEEEEESRKNVREIGRLARLCCGYISSRGTKQKQIEEEFYQPIQQLLVSTANWRVENYIDKTRSTGKLSDSYEFNVAVIPTKPEEEDSQVVKPETDNVKQSTESDGIKGESSFDETQGSGPQTTQGGGVKFSDLEKLTIAYGLVDYSRITLCVVLMQCRVVTTVTHIVWNYYVGAGLKDINEADCYQYEEVSTRHLKGFSHKNWKMNDGDIGVLLDGKLLPRSVFDGDYDKLIAQITFVKSLGHPDFAPIDRFFEVKYETAERTDEVTDEINLMDTPEYIWGSIWMPGIYHGLWVAGLYDSLGYIDIPDFLKQNELNFGASVDLGNYGSSKTEVVTVEDYISVTSPLPTLGTQMPPSKSDCPSSAHTKVYDVDGKLIFQSDGLYDLAGVLDKIPNVKSDIGQIVHQKNGVTSTYKPEDFD